MRKESTRVSRIVQVARRTPLRVRLVGLAVLLSAAALVVSGVVVTRALADSMLARTDQSLLDAEKGWARPLGELPPGQLPPGASPPGPERPPSWFYVHVQAADGETLALFNDESTSPDLAGMGMGTPTTVPATEGTGVRWRALRFTTPRGETLTIATPLTANDAVVRRLAGLQIWTGLVVLALLAGAAYLTVRQSLRGLREVERTTAAIAEGDLSRRVPESDPRTEVGALAIAVNSMLSQIQDAFAATAASERKMRRFIADASHDLRTPITTIRGFAELYRQGASTDMDRLMARIESESRRMGALVEDLLALARLDERRPHAQEPVDLVVLAADAVHDARAVAPERETRLELFPGTDGVVVTGDDARLRQVLGNLVDNALTHTPDNSTITVRVGTRGDSAVLEVADNGPGLAAEDLESIFERFYRADSSRTSTSGGNGLGLSIVAGIVEAHGGSVAAESGSTAQVRLGAGATFRVLLPRRDAP
ncbi:sensor histidine kinase [Tomitella biformata]|uniref:sensor histidine kinase n=1 Tax=Tomitella biformata TaxID=630403 RepID=UPI0006869208|nr:HAMP domain-containing sensor histidine kinase [Tomitella biformata]